MTKFYIGNNKFDENELNNYKDIPIVLPDNLEKLGISGSFDEKTNYFIKNIKINNLKILYIRNNELNSFEILKNIYFNRLQILWALYNRITDIKSLFSIENKEEITQINLAGNEITKIDEDIFYLP